jgi:hypothetical protein
VLSHVYLKLTDNDKQYLAENPRTDVYLKQRLNFTLKFNISSLFIHL